MMITNIFIKEISFFSAFSSQNNNKTQEILQLNVQNLSKYSVSVKIQ